MKQLRRTGAFRGDIRRAERRGYDLRRLAAALELLQRGERLPAALRSHPLKGSGKAIWNATSVPIGS